VAKRRPGRQAKQVKIEYDESGESADIPAKITFPKNAKATPTKGKAKAKANEVDAKSDTPATQTVQLTVTELSAYCEEAYRAGRHTILLANNLLVDLRQLMNIIEDMKAPTSRWPEQGRDTVIQRINAARYPNHLMNAEAY
jgi:hypothetical protein